MSAVESALETVCSVLSPSLETHTHSHLNRRGGGEKVPLKSEQRLWLISLFPHSLGPHVLHLTIGPGFLGMAQVICP